MVYFLTIGILLGVSAGLTPGPLLTLVISETLRHDMGAGIKVAIAPIITDLPIIIFTIFLLAKISGYRSILGILSLIGGVFIFFIGYESLRTKGVMLNLGKSRPKSLTKGVIANALNPHPYLFWLSVGAPTVIKALSQDIFAAFAFLVSFYALLVGSKIVLAVFIGRSKTFLAGNFYLYAMRFLGLMLWILAIILFRDGLRLLGIL
jgi:threonine/homoserine/homoserine lactone efflux protein